MKSILLTGGSGYVGTRLTFLLLKLKKYVVVNYDTSYFGDEHLPIQDQNYFYYKQDIRNSEQFEKILNKHKIDIVIHLACISNDPSYLLNPLLSKEINFDCFENLVIKSKNSGVKKFIYASTCSVYGVSEKDNVDENHPLLPITDYNKYKGMCEPQLINQLDNNFQGLIIRPATVCGYSEKMRFDLTVNILTNFAFNKGFIKVFGGEQFRPNTHIDDMCDLYVFLIEKDFSKINGEIYNFGYQNLKVKDIAQIVKDVVEKKTNKKIEIIFEKSDDIRSYRVNSDKIQNKLGFKFKKSVKDAVEDLIDNFQNGKIKNSFDEKFQNVKVLQNNKIN